MHLYVGVKSVVLSYYEHEPVVNGERMKEAEQSLLFLKRCHNNNIFPVFILSFKFSDSIFPANEISSYGQLLIYKLKLMCLNQNISFKYQFIKSAQSDIQTRNNCTGLNSQCGFPFLVPTSQLPYLNKSSLQ